MVVLGLCCLADSISFKTITLKKYNTLSESEKITAIEDIYLANIAMLDNAIQFCFDNQIMMYRMSSSMFPLSDYCSIAYEIFNEMKDELAVVGSKANKLKIRLLQHPSQFVVLNSDNAEVIDKSVHNLKLHTLLMNYLKQPKTHKALLNIHGGKRDNLDLLIKTINNLDSDIKSRLTLENDEDYYCVKDLYYIYEHTGIPILFDFHHYLVKHKLKNYDSGYMEVALETASSTWSDKYQTCHLSNGFSSFHDRKHSYEVKVFPEICKIVPYLEMEFRSKEHSIFVARQLLK